MSQPLCTYFIINELIRSCLENELPLEEDRMVEYNESLGGRAGFR